VARTPERRAAAAPRLEPRALPGRVGRGRGVAVVFNRRARHVTPAAIAAVAAVLPDAELVLTRTTAECDGEIAKLAARPRPARLVLSAGGDGAVTALLNAWRRTGRPMPPLGLLPLGTGNAWAHSTHAPKLKALLRLLPGLRWPLPTRRFALLDCEGTLCPFAGTGWDARLLDDYTRHREGQVGQLLPRPLRDGLGGYLAAGLRFTVPEGLAHRRPHARVTTSAPAWEVGPGERLVERPAGALWDGRFSVLAMGTTPQYGFHFEAFPFAGEVPGTFNLRVYDRPLWLALPDLPRLWRGVHPLRGMHDFFVRDARVTVSPPQPFQLAGDDVGERHELAVRLAAETVDVVDWAGGQSQ